MRANSRSRLRWRIATAFAALALGALPISFDGDVFPGHALADGGDNGRLLAAYPKARPTEATSDGEKQGPVAGLADDASGKLTTGTNPGDDGYRIGDDSDIASVEGSANDTEDAGEFFDDTF